MSRDGAFGQDRALTWVDRYGVWLSARQVRRHAGDVAGLRVCDAGSGFHATLARELCGMGARVTAVDLALSPALREVPGMACVEGELPAVLESLPGASWDLVQCLSVLEHLRRPGEALAHFHRMLAPGGLCLVNVPSWRGKRFLEFSAFRLGLSPRAEMDDHKRYYDERDLWPILVEAGFLPSGIRCFSHKFGLNTFAACRKGAP